MIPTHNSPFFVEAQSHPGRRRPNNEDRYAVTYYRLGDRKTPALLAIVADGIGGHLAGEVASQLTVETIQRSMAAYDGGDPIPHLETAVIEAGRAVSKSAAESAERTGMGSTVAVAFIVGDRLFTVSVGDSRIYLLRDGRLRQISIDHTWVQEAIDYDIISAEEARGHPNAHVLRRHIGGQQLPEPDFRMMLHDGENESRSIANQGTRLQRGDRLLLCSDGLTDMVEDLEIFQALTEHAPEQAVTALMHLALERGGDDNITIVVIAPRSGSQAGASRRRRGVLLPALLGSLVLLLLVAAALAAAWWLGYWPWKASRESSAGALPRQVEIATPLIEEASAIPEQSKTATMSPADSLSPPTATFTAVPLPTEAPPSTP